MSRVRQHDGATENARTESAAPSKMQGWKTRDWKTWHHMTRVETAGLENAAPVCRGWKCGTECYGTPKMQ